MADRAERSRQLVADLDVTPVGEMSFTGVTRCTVPERVFGGHLVAQALVAAGRTVPADRLPHSLHAYFHSPGRIVEPVRLDVRVLREGRSFAQRHVRIRQGDTLVLSAMCSFAPATTEAAPTGRLTYGLPGATGETPPGEDSSFRIDEDDGGAIEAFDLRQRQKSPDATGSVPPLVWLRLADGPVLEPLLQAAVVAYASDIAILDGVVARHGSDWSGTTAASLDHAMGFHRQHDPGAWFAYGRSSPVSSSGRALANGWLLDEQGRLIAAVAQEALMKTSRGHG